MSSLSPTWDDYRRWLGPELSGGLPETLAPPSPGALLTDSRALESAAVEARGKDELWFVPLVGPNFDGHDYVERALGAGARGFFYEVGRAGKIPEALRARGVPVKNTLTAFQALAAGWRRSLKDLRLAALTGSTGKTTTKEMLAGIFAAAGESLGTFGSFNNEIGVPKTLLRLRPEHRYAAVEFGARNEGDIRFLAEMASPDVCCVLNVGRTHLGIFGSEDALLRTKTEMFRHAPTGATLVAPASDDRVIAEAKKTGLSLLTFSTGEDADVRVVDVRWLEEGATEMTLALAGSSLTVRVPVSHEALPINAAAAAAMALAAGVPSSVLARGLSAFTGVKGRYQIHRRGRLVIVDDTYNASPHSMEVGFRTLARSYPERRKVLILGDMLELGPDSPDEHRSIGQKAVDLVKPARLFTVGQEARAIAEGAVTAGLPKAAVTSFDDVGELLAQKIDWEAEGEVLYAKASHGIGLGRLIAALVGEAP